MDSKILTNSFNIIESSSITPLKEIPYPTYDNSSIVRKISLLDMLYIDLFTSKYQGYNQVQKKLNSNDKYLMYFKQAALVNLFEMGASSLSNEMIQADSSFFNIYHAYKNARNALAHATTIDENERNILISNLEKYTSLFYETLT